MARHAGGIEVHRALPVLMQAAALTGAMAQAVVHVAKHHQRQRPLFADAHDRLLQILIAPITGRALPIPPAGISRPTAQATGAAVGQQHQRKISWSTGGSGVDACG